MKNKYFLSAIAIVCIATLLLTVQSCSDSNEEIPEEIIPGTEGGEENPEISMASIDMVSKLWGGGIAEIKGEQRKGLSLVEEDSEFLKYTNKNQSFCIAYDFVDNRLRASVLLVAVNSTIDAGRYKLTGYNYLGNIDGSSVYTSPDGYTLGTIINRNIDGQNYVAIGFTPLESELFETIDPIVVTTLAAEDIGKSSMTLCGSFSGYAENPKAVIRYSINRDLSNANDAVCRIADGRFKYTVTDLKPNSTVYYKAMVTDEDIVYEGDVLSAEVEHQKLYSIGDPYPDGSSPEGIVCAIKNSGANGTIVSLDQDYLKWDLAGIFCTQYYCRSTTDGSLNDMGNTNPYAKWVKQHGAGWYGPARGQLVISKDNLAKINSGLSANNGAILEGFYWSSSEYNSNCAWVTTVTETSYMGYSNGHYFYNNKDNARSVVAMKNF